MDDIILIYEKPENYFFPGMDNVYAPYAVEFHSPKYYLYRVLHILRIPLYRAFWGEWKNRIKECKKVIIFDYGYQRGMDTYIRKVNPKCEVYLFYWNKVSKYRNGYKSFREKEHIYSFDIGDCEKYGFRYNSSFILWNKRSDIAETDNKRVFFIGGDKDNRAEKLLRLKENFESVGFTADFRMFANNDNEDYKKKYSDLIIDSYLPYDECLKRIMSSGIILDITQEGQQGLTLRFVESVMLSKKLITNNEFVKNYAIYESGNIYVLKEEDFCCFSDELKEFLGRPFNPYSEEQINEYSYDKWINRFV